jgi:hypothetical protein
MKSLIQPRYATVWTLAVCQSCLLVLGGCGVKQPPPVETGREVREVKVYIPPPEEAKVPEEPPPELEEVPDIEGLEEIPVETDPSSSLPPAEVISPPGPEEEWPEPSPPPAVEASLPPELSRQEGVRTEPFITRGLVAELIAALPDIPREGKKVIIMTDILEHPSRSNIIQVVGNGYMDVFPNHEFKPQAFVSRAEMADILWRLVSAATDLGEIYGGGPEIIDLPATNRYYEPVRGAVDLGLLSLEQDGRFDPTRPVTGTEAWETLIRLYRLLKVHYG